LPDWVRGRGLAMYVTVFFGTMTLGSVLWGELANEVGLRWAVSAIFWKAYRDLTMAGAGPHHQPTPTTPRAARLARQVHQQPQTFILFFV